MNLNRIAIIVGICFVLIFAGFGYYMYEWNRSLDKEQKSLEDTVKALRVHVNLNIRFVKTEKDVHPGEEVTFKAKSKEPKITKAELVKADPKLTITFTDDSVTVKADKEAAEAKDIEIAVIGEDNTKATLKVTVKKK